jgi:hypothetical protein
MHLKERRARRTVDLEPGRRGTEIPDATEGIMALKGAYLLG